MSTRQSHKDAATRLSGKERGAIAAFLVYIEDRMKDAEPVCAKLVRMARLSLTDPGSLQDLDRILH